MSLYLKYRPRTIDELDLDGVRATLEGIVKANQISHAYLLTGPRGAGKTSTARVIARIVNCEKRLKNQKKHQKIGGAVQRVRRVPLDPGWERSRLCGN